MADMANITVQNAAAANVIFVKKTASAGDRSAAKWTQDAAHAVPAFRPRFDLTTRDNGPKDARVFESNFAFPVIGPVGGVDTLLGTVVIRASGTMPIALDSTKVNDAIVQHSNVLASSLIRQALAEGYAPT